VCRDYVVPAPGAELVEGSVPVFDVESQFLKPDFYVLVVDREVKGPMGVVQALEVRLEKIDDFFSVS